MRRGWIVRALVVGPLLASAPAAPAAHAAAPVRQAAAPAVARASRARVTLLDRTAAFSLKRRGVRLRVYGLRGGVVRVRIAGRVPAAKTARRRLVAFTRTRRVRLSPFRSRKVRLPLTATGRRALRLAVARCRSLRFRIVIGRRHYLRYLRGGRHCAKVRPGTVGGPAPGPPAKFQVGAAVGDFSPPVHGALAADASDCAGALGSIYSGARPWAFMEPYIDQKGSGHYDGPVVLGVDTQDPTQASLGDPYLDCNGNGRWDGNLLGGNNAPRFYNKIADPVGARAMVVSNGAKTIAVEVVDQEGLFNVYQQRIRDRVAADGYHLDGIFISATHDESAPDSLGINGVSPLISSVNAYFTDYLVAKSAKAIENAFDNRRTATIRYAEGREPANLRQCWSSYPFVDDQLMPTLQAVDSSGAPIVTLASISQHAETGAFNDIAAERVQVTGDIPHFVRAELERRYGGVGIAMAGSVGSVETPEVFAGAISRVPQRFVPESHPAGCRTLFDAAGTRLPEGYATETKALGEGLATGVAAALDTAAQYSTSNEIWGARRDVCIPLGNSVFQAAAAAGVFAARPSYTGNCSVEVAPTPNGSTNGTELLSQVAAFQIGDGAFISVPGEVFPFTYLRSFLGPADLPVAGATSLPAWPLPRMRTAYRFIDGLGEDMIGYIFPSGNAVGVPDNPGKIVTGTSSDRFGCNHSDDGEAASAQAGDLLGTALAGTLSSHGGASETVRTGRYVLADGSLSRDPLGGPVIKCNTDKTYQPRGPAVAVSLPGEGVVTPPVWMSLGGRPQAAPDRDTRGFFDRAGHRVWLDVFPDVSAP